MTTIPRIYVACLAAYNNGELHGRWIDANQSVAEIHAEIQDILSSSPESFAEEWAVHDFEGFGSIDLGEYPDLSRVSKIAELIIEHGDAFAVWYTSQDGSCFCADDLAEKFNEQSCGRFDSEVDFARDLLENTGQLAELPEWAANYFDFESYARDLRISGDFSFVHHDCSTYVFSNY